MTIAQITDPVVAICINQQFEYCLNGAELYNCTRGLWRLNRKRAENARYALAVFQGEIKEVYEIERWVPASQDRRDFWIQRLKSQGRIINPLEHEGRSDFIGRVASDNVREKYVGKTMPVRQGQNPIHYFNC
jgi:hypothetical protein